MDTAGEQGKTFGDLGLRQQGPVWRAVLGVCYGKEAYFFNSRELRVRT